MQIKAFFIKMYLYSSLFAQIIKLNTFFIATLQSVNTIYNNSGFMFLLFDIFQHFIKFQTTASR